MVRTVVVMAVMLSSTACGGDDGKAVEPPAGSPTTSAAPTTEEQVLAAYDAQWAEWLRATDPPDPDADYLTDGMTGKTLRSAINEIRKFEAEGMGVRGSYDTDATVVELTDTTAVIADCGYDRTESYRLDTGKVINRSDDERDPLFANMVVEDGDWKITSYKRDKPPCDT